MTTDFFYATYTLIGTYIGEYEILGLIAGGGMGLVLKARHALSGQIVALKLLPRHLLYDVSNVRRLQRESRILSQLNHQNIVNTVTFDFSSAGEPYLVIEYVEGSTLREIVQSHGAIPARRAIPLFSQIVNAMSFAHGKGILHRDLKPHNIMVSRQDCEDQIKIVDFGIAWLSAESQKITRTGEIVGSPIYISPEQCYGQSADVRSEIYSLGVVMFQTLTGQVPFSGENIVQIIRTKCSASPPRFKDVNPELSCPQLLEEIVLKCMAQDPSDRYGSMAEVNQNLQDVIEEVSGIIFAKSAHTIRDYGSVASTEPDEFDTSNGDSFSGDAAQNHGVASRMDELFSNSHPCPDDPPDVAVFIESPPEIIRPRPSQDKHGTPAYQDASEEEDDEEEEEEEEEEEILDDPEDERDDTTFDGMYRRHIVIDDSQSSKRLVAITAFVLIAVSASILISVVNQDTSSSRKTITSEDFHGAGGELHSPEGGFKATTKSMIPDKSCQSKKPDDKPMLACLAPITSSPSSTVLDTTKLPDKKATSPNSKPTIAVSDNKITSPGNLKKHTILPTTPRTPNLIRREVHRRLHHHNHQSSSNAPNLQRRRAYSTIDSYLQAEQ